MSTSTIFAITLSGDQEVPAVTTTAFGFGTAFWDADAQTLIYSVTVGGIDFSALTGAGATTDTGDDLRSMHIHTAARGANGPVVFGQFSPAQDPDDVSFTANADGTTTVRGVWETTDAANQPITNFAAIFSAGTLGTDAPLYFNVHSNEFTSGEVRGQFVGAGLLETGTTGEDALRVARGENGWLRGLDGDDALTGGLLADLIGAGAGADSVIARAGNDSVAGGDGADLLDGGRGDDSLTGGEGADTLIGRRGDDSMAGGAGADQFVFARSRQEAQSDSITDFDAAEDLIILTGFGAGQVEAILDSLTDVAGGVSVDLLHGNTLFVAGTTAAALETAIQIG